MNITQSPSANKYDGRNGWKPDMIVCHIAEGSYAGTVSWLKNPQSQASAHFVVAQDGRVTQLVSLTDAAWCNGTAVDPSKSTYYGKSTLAAVRDRATNANYYTVSIEHEGKYVETHGALTDAQRQATTELIAYIRSEVKRLYGTDIPLDRDHIVGHYQVTPIAKPHCPGEQFPFDSILSALSGSTSETVYAAVSGDTLSSIAAKYGTTYQSLAKYNSISDPNKIYVGQQIKIPDAASNTPAATTAPANTSSSAPAASKPANWDQRGPHPTLVWDYNYDSAVADLQRILNSKGASLAVDGKAGDNTYNAVKGYTVKKGDGGPLTKWVQQRLTSVGCPCGAIDGIAGDKTMAAIKSFQAYYNLGQGYLGGTDWYYLIR